MSSFPLALHLSAQVLTDRLAEDVRVLMVRDVSTVTDYFVIGTATGAPHLRALADELESAAKDKRLRARRKQGEPISGWMVLDFGDVVVHLMTRDLREFYALEQLWSDGKQVSLEAL